MERGVSYVRANALKGRRFKSLSEENLFLKQWESQVADKRIHGTTRKQVATCFEEERAHLQPLGGAKGVSQLRSKLLRRQAKRKRWSKDLKIAIGVPNCTGSAVCFS